MTATGTLDEMEALIASTPTDPPVEVVSGRLQGVMGHTTLEWLLGDLALPATGFRHSRLIQGKIICDTYRL
jgi:hypothetical protein